MIRIYYRVSTDKQDFGMQDNAIRNLLKSKDISYDDCAIYKDFGMSGTTSQRSDYQRLLAEVLENDIIVVYEFSRLWRDLEEQSRAIKMFLALKVCIISVVDGELDTPTSTLFADIKGSINQFEARRLKERINAGLDAKKAKVEAGIETWKRRGKDKKPRSKEGYFRRWSKSE